MSILNFKPARYRPGKDSHVAFYSWNPNKLKLQRVKIRLNHIDEKQRERYGIHLAKKLTEQLYSGWSPFDKLGTNRGTQLKDAINLWVKAKARELRPNSMRSYRSFAKKFQWWLTQNKLHLACEQFETGHALKMMNEVLVRNKSLRTYNSHLGAFKNIFHWLIANEFCVANPFEKMRKKNPGMKDRDIIPPKMRTAILKSLDDDDGLRLAAQLVFYCLIRPNELTFLKPSNFDLKAQTIYIPPDASKNKTGDKVTIPDVALKSIHAHMRKFKPKPNEFIFSDQRTFLPGTEKMDSRYFSKRWEKLRQELKMPMSFKFYSLKDSGIVQMLEDGISPNDVMKQARHSSLEITTEYLKYVSTGASHQVKTKMRKF